MLVKLLKARHYQYQLAGVQVWEHLESNVALALPLASWRRALSNLLQNAYEALLLLPLERDRRLSCRSFLRDNYYVLEISDSAGSLAPEQWQARYQPAAPTAAHGLGLRLATQLLEKDCLARLENTVVSEQSTKFTIRLAIDNRLYR